MLSKTDIAVLTALEADARLSFAQLGQAVGLSKSPCWKRVQALEQAGAIKGYRTLLDPAVLGLEVAAFVSVTVAFDRHAEFEQAVARHRAILACHATIGEADYLLKVTTASMADLDHLLRQELWRLPGVQRFTTTMTMRTVKDDGLLTSALPRP
ncbi:Lrp/AsnC family transcriptional regulator [Phenylobacterium montanum]|uniref:Lrp/AsnC family transcriptional regulator n=1 Tax=Phenylobacterium montanum TaxID=2823693 RepID=A0A975FZY7_9CAUL|nr:Lrp/AsnC family transcriptional regulator [Caulobacter sp. S6]QUD88375.1 Lrp/AsnC family transcriptional regulator [Caulobacter sp. S6]